MTDSRPRAFARRQEGPIDRDPRGLQLPSSSSGPPARVRQAATSNTSKMLPPPDAAVATAPSSLSPPPPLSPRALHPRPKNGRQHFTHILLDLDDCLYREERVAHLVRQHIVEYIERELGVEREEAARLTQELYVQHGTTMAGLASTGHPLDPDHWHRHVHAPLPYEQLLSRDDRLVEMLQALTTGPNAPRVQVFTNADRTHMLECLQRLGIAAAREGEEGGGIAWDGPGYYFERVQELGAQRGLVPDAAHPGAGHKGKGFLAKPDPALFRLVAEDCGAASPSCCVFVDDSVRNVAAARSVGMTTVLVGRRRDERVPGADLCIETVLELPEVLPELFGCGRGGGVEAEECAAVGAQAGVAVRVVAG